MNGPTSPASTTGSDAMKLLELLADPKRAAEVIAEHDAAKAAAEAAQAKLAEQSAQTKADLAALTETTKALKSREVKLDGETTELARRRDDTLRELEVQKITLGSMSSEMAQRKAAFEQEWATADVNQRNRTAALDERERLLTLREETVRAKESVLASACEVYERDREVLNARQSNLRKLLEQG